MEVDWRLCLPCIHVLFSQHCLSVLRFGQRLQRRSPLQRFVLGHQRHGLVSSDASNAEHGLGYHRLGLVFRNNGICTLDEVRRQRKRIINTSLVVLMLAFVAYIVLNFVILTELGVALNLPWESSRLWN